MGHFAALALIVLGQAIAPSPAPGPTAGAAAGAGPLTLTADMLRYQTDTGRVEADGHVELKGQGVTVRAQHMTYDTRSRRVTAEHALIVRGETVGVADAVQLDLDTDDATLEGGLFVQKKGVSVDELVQAQSADALLGAGKNQLALRGVRIRRVSERELEVEHLSFTPCDCNPAAPSWRIDARKADVTVGDSVLLSWPVIYVHGVPVLAFPVLDLPLKDRRTGLLIPKPSSSTYSGFNLEQPFFLTLGDSYDLTFTPGYFFGGSSLRGVQGPELETDFRYAPVEGTRGELALHLYDDFKQPRWPNLPSVAIPNPDDPAALLSRGLRWSLGGGHTQELGGGWADRVDLALVSDGFLAGDLSTDLLTQQNRYLRSDATLFQREEDRYLGVALGYRQDVRYGFDLFGTARTQPTADAPDGLSGPRTLQQLPDAVASWPARRVFGDWLLGMDLRFTRLAPLTSSFGDEGEMGIYTFSSADPGKGDGVYQPGERVARDRLDLNPSLSTAWSAGRFLTLTPTVALRQDLYADERGGKPQARGHVWADLRVDSRLARTFGGTGGVTHAIEPSLELRYAPPAWGPGLAPVQGPLTSGLRPYDELDLSMPDEGITQAVAQVSQKLVQRQGLATRELLRLDLGEELDLRAAHPPRDAFARVGTELWGLHLLGIARYDVVGKRLAQLTGSASIAFAQRAALYAVYNDLLVGGTALQRRGLDTLVGTAYVPLPAPDPSNPPPDRAQILTAGGSLQLFGGLGARYDFQVQPGAVQALTRQAFGLSYAPACDCWKVEVQAVFAPDAADPAHSPFGAFRFAAGLTINGFGRIGTGG